MRAVFMGTPAAAAKICDWLADRVNLVAIVTQPDRFAGRGQSHLVSPPVKDVALRRGIPLLQPDNVNAPEVLEKLSSCQPDLSITIAYSQFLKAPLLKLAKLHSINVHFSLLPRHRGAAPVNYAIFAGDQITGVTVQEMAIKMDAGDVLAQRSTNILPSETSGELFDRLTDLAILTLDDFLNMLRQGTVVKKPQDESQITFARKISKEDGRIDWAQSAEEIHNRIRGCLPWPVASTQLLQPGGVLRLGILSAEVKFREMAPYAPGIIYDFLPNGGLLVACGKGSVVIKKLHPENKKPISAEDFRHGYRLSIGTQLA